MTEVWKPVTTHPDRYEVSSWGNVRLRERVIVRGCCRCALPAQRLKTAVGGRARNYRRVRLHTPSRHAYVHHLVAEAFIGPRPAGLKVCHRDDNGFNNRADNIYYGTRDENEMDRWINGHREQLAAMDEAPF